MSYKIMYEYFDIKHEEDPLLVSGINEPPDIKIEIETEAEECDVEHGTYGDRDEASCKTLSKDVNIMKTELVKCEDFLECVDIEHEIVLNSHQVGYTKTTSEVEETQEDLDKLPNSHYVQTHNIDGDVTDFTPVIGGYNQTNESYIKEEKCHGCDGIPDKDTLCLCKNSFSSCTNFITGSQTADKAFRCNICDKLFFIEQKFTEHLCVHSSSHADVTGLSGNVPNEANLNENVAFIVEKQLSCNSSNESFSEKDVMITHTLNHKNEELPYSCNICRKTFSTKYILNRHTRTHTKEKPFSCSHCKRAFSQKSHLIDHVRIHSNDNIFSCNFCSMSFDHKSDLIVHKRIHFNNILISCNVCSMPFTFESKLKRHMRTHTQEKPFTCNFCSRSFSDKFSLNRHTRTHTNEKPFTCDYCSKSFSDKSKLTEHIRIHSNEKSYKCRFCSKAFTAKFSLSRHIRTHTNDKPFTCIFCSKSFSDKSNLNQHIRIHSNEK